MKGVVLGGLDEAKKAGKENRTAVRTESMTDQWGIRSVIVRFAKEGKYDLKVLGARGIQGMRQFL